MSCLCTLYGSQYDHASQISIWDEYWHWLLNEGGKSFSGWFNYQLSNCCFLCKWGLDRQRFFNPSWWACQCCNQEVSYGWIHLWFLIVRAICYFRYFVLLWSCLSKEALWRIPYWSIWPKCNQYCQGVFWECIYCYFLNDVWRYGSWIGSIIWSWFR